MSTDFAMPDLGEGLTESELVAWHVTVGQLVELNQPIAEVETAKAIVQLPSPFAGGQRSSSDDEQSIDQRINQKGKPPEVGESVAERKIWR